MKKCDSCGNTSAFEYLGKQELPDMKVEEKWRCVPCNHVFTIITKITQRFFSRNAPKLENYRE